MSRRHIKIPKNTHLQSFQPPQITRKDDNHYDTNIRFGSLTIAMHALVSAHTRAQAFPSLELELCGLLLLRPLRPQLFGTLRLSTASQFGFYVMPAFLSSLQPILCKGSVGRNTRNLTVSFPVHGAIILVAFEARETSLLLSFSFSRRCGLNCVHPSSFLISVYSKFNVNMAISSLVLPYTCTYINMIICMHIIYNI